MCLRGDLAPVAGERYVISLDLGLKNDATVAAVAHRELVDDGDRGSWRVVVDHLRRWRGSREQPLEIGLVEQELASLSERFDRAQVVVDPWQAMGLVQRLRARGVSAEEFPFTTQSVGRLAHGLYSLLRSRRLHLLDDEVLREELLAVRLRETQPGQYRLDHDAGRHDDQAVAIALAGNHLLRVGERPMPRIRWIG